MYLQQIQNATIFYIMAEKNFWILSNGITSRLS